MADKKKKSWNSIVTVNGIQMSVEERNRLIKLEYINGGVALSDIAMKYGIAYQTLRSISCKEKWKDQKEKFACQIAKEAEQELTEIYVATRVDVNLLYNNAWQALMQEVVTALKTKEGLKNKNGDIDWYKMNQLADVLTKAHTGQQITTGFINREAQAKLNIQTEAMEIKKSLLGMGADEIIEDNFLDCLEAAAVRCGITKKEEDDNGTKPKE